MHASYQNTAGVTLRLFQPLLLTYALLVDKSERLEQQVQLRQEHRTVCRIF